MDSYKALYKACTNCYPSPNARYMRLGDLPDACIARLSAMRISLPWSKSPACSGAQTGSSASLAARLPPGFASTPGVEQAVTSPYFLEGQA